MNTKSSGEPASDGTKNHNSAARVCSGDSVSFFWKGRVALYAILKSLGIAGGDRVVVPGYTCVVVPEAVHFLGAKPVFADIDPRTYNVSLERVQATVSECRGPVRAVIVQHTYGLPADTAAILKWARPRGIAVIEDCCHSLGSRYTNEAGAWQDVGTIGDAAFFSSQWSKPVSTGLGGWAVANCPALAKVLRAFAANECISPSQLECAILAAQVAGRAIFSSSRSFWFAQTTYRYLSRAGIGIGSSSREEERGERPSKYAKRMSRFQLWLLRRKLGGLDDLIQHRRRLRLIYDEELAKAAVRQPPGSDPVLLRYPVRVANKEEVLDAARHNRIELGDWFDHPLHPKKFNRTGLGYCQGMCPNAEEAARQVVNLPLHARVSEQTARETVAFLKREANPISLQKVSVSTYGP